MSIRGSDDVSFWPALVVFAFACLLCYIIGIQAGLSDQRMQVADQLCYPESLVRVEAPGGVSREAVTITCAKTTIVLAPDAEMVRTAR